VTSARRQRLIGITSLVAGARAAGCGVSVHIPVTTEEVAEVRDLVTSLLGREQDTIDQSDVRDAYYWFGEVSIALIWRRERETPVEVPVVDLQAARLDKQLRDSLARYGLTPVTDTDTTKEGA
jgi:hypothetical protein